MGRRPKKDLRAFQEWLIDTKGLAPSSTSAYASKVRRILADLSMGITTEALDRWFESIESRKMASSARSAWRSFVQYCDEKGVEVPLPSETETIKNRGPEYRFPEEVTRALWIIVQEAGISIGKLSTFKWSHLRREMFEGAWLLEDPETKGLVYRAPIQACMDLERWASPGGVDDPLVPVSPGSGHSVPAPALRRAMGRGRRAG